MNDRRLCGNMLRDYSRTFGASERDRRGAALDSFLRCHARGGTIFHGRFNKGTCQSQKGRKRHFKSDTTSVVKLLFIHASATNQVLVSLVSLNEQN